MERAEVVRHLMRNIKKHGFPFEKLTTVTFSLKRGRGVPSSVVSELDANNKNGTRGIQLNMIGIPPGLNNVVLILKAKLAKDYPKIRIHYIVTSHLTDPDTTANRYVRLRSRGKNQEAEALRQEMTHEKTSILVFSNEPLRQDVFM